MTGWDYVAIGGVWYLLAARVAIGSEFHLSLTTVLLWPLFLASLVPRNIRRAGFRTTLFRKAVSLSLLALVTVCAYVLTGYVATNVLIRFVLTFPMASLATVVLFAGGAVIYHLFDRETAGAPRGATTAGRKSGSR